MSAVLAAEWTKLRTSPGTGWTLLAAVVLTVAVSWAACATASCAGPGCPGDPAKTAYTGVLLGQAVVVVFAVMLVGGEYATGMIRVTLAAMPRRGEVLAAKAVLLVGLVLGVGSVAVLASFAVAAVTLPGRGYTAAHGFAALSLTDGAVLRATAGSVGYLVLVGLLGLGLAAMVREAAAAVGVALGLLYVLPIVALAVPSPHWQRRIDQFAPMSAGLAIQATRGLRDLPISPWRGLGVLAAWAAAAGLAGWALLRARDA